MPHKTRSLLLGLLVASGALNVWLLRSSGAPDRVRSEPAAPTRDAPRGVAAVPAPQPSALELCNRQLTTTRFALESAKEDLAQRIEPKTRFEEGQRERGMESRMTPAIDAALAKAKGVTTHTLECRTELCQIRLSTSTREQALNAWRTLTSDPALRKLSDGFMHEAGDPVVDLATGKGGFDVDLYLFTRSAADATNDIEAFVAQFRASGVLDRCAGAGDDRGVLEVRISVAGDDVHPTIAIGGSLAGTRVGRCISEPLEDEVHRLTLPPGSKYGVVYASIPSPRGE